MKGTSKATYLSKQKILSSLNTKSKLVHRRLTNIRNNHLHQATSKIVKTKPSPHCD